MIRRPPRSTRTDTLFPYTTLFRSAGAANCSRWKGLRAMKPMTVESLMARSAEAEENGDHILATEEMWRALWLEKSGRSEAYFIGASPMPRLRQGDLVTIRKDTRILGTFPDSLLHGRLANGRGYRIAKRTYQVKIRDRKSTRLNSSH